MLPVANGDSILIEYGDIAHPRRLRVDAGPHFTYAAVRQRIERLGPKPRHLELLVITHIDTDHIDGAIRLLLDKELGVTFGDIWFNGWKQLRYRAKDQLGALQGEFLGALIEKDGLQWNGKFGGDAIVVPEEGELPRRRLEGDLWVTLVSPGERELLALRREWVNVLRGHHFEPGNNAEALARLARRAEYGPRQDVLGRGPDDSVANGSSIALLLEYEGRRVLLGADAFSDGLLAGLQRYGRQHGIELVALDAFKLAHHGSFGNISKPLLNAMRAQRYLVSSDGQKFKHPDAATIELILKSPGDGKPLLVFNYLSRFTEPWSNREDQERRGYDAAYPPDHVVEL